MTLRHKLSSVAVMAAICVIAQVCSPSIARAGTAATATQVAFTTTAAGAAGGLPFTAQPVVTVEDSSGNKVTSSSAVVTLSISGGASGASLTCTTNPVTASSGVASFAGCTIDKASTTGYTLTATANGLTSATMQLTVPPGPADKVVFTRTTTGGAGGVAWPTQPVVTIEDKAGNTETGSTSRVALALAPGANGASLTCPPVNAVAGVATFSGCSIDTGGTYTLIATDGGDQKQTQLSGVVISANTRPATLSFTTSPGSGTGAAALPTQPVVSVKDAGNNGVVASVTLTLAGGAPGATLTCTANPVTTLSSGTATFAGCRVDKAGTGYYLNATVNSLSVASTAFDVTAGAANHLIFSTAPGGGTGGTALSAQPVVTVVDVAGNRVTTSTASIGLAITAGTGAAGAALACVATTVPAGGGNAAFAGCAIDRASATAYTLTATDTADSLSAISPPITINVGPASRLAFTTQPSGAVPATNFSGQPAVTVLDAGGNAVTSGPPAVTLSIGTGTGTAGAALTCASNPTSPSSGIATFSACKIDKAGTGYVLHAAAPGTTGADSTSFSVATSPPPVTGVTPVVPLAQTFGGRDYGANPTLVTDDVNSATGSLFLSTTDLTVAGIGVPFSLTRSYDSANATGGSFGPGWTSLFDAGVQVSAAGDKATVRGEDGQTLVFSSNGSGGWVAPPGARTTLACSGLNCTVTRFDGVSWHSAAGRIQDYLAPSGQGLHLAYGANGVASVTVTTSSGPALTIAVTTNPAGLVTAVTTPTRSTAYGYTNGLLTAFTDARGQVWTYGYDASGRLTSQTDPLGHLRRSVTYAPSGRVASSVTTGDPGRHDVTFSWDSTTQTATRAVLQDVDGVATRVVFADVYRGNVLISQRQPDGGHTDYAYDSTLELTQIKDPLGWVQQNTYSPAGDLITQSSPTSATTSAVSRKGYDTQHHLLSATDPAGHTTTFTYSGAQLVTMTPPGGPTSTYTYDSFGQAVGSTTATGSRTFTYDRFGNPTSRQQLSPTGQILNGAGEQRAYDEAGNEVQSVDPRGVVTGGAPNPAYVTTQSYGPTGLLLTKTQPGAVAKTTTYTYDNAGTLASVTDPTGRVTTHSWNEATRTLTTSNPGGTTSQTYDASGNVVSATDASGAVTISRYNNVGLKSASIDPTKVTTSFGYDLAERMVSANDSTGNTSTFAYDALGRQTSKTTNGRTTTTSYDAASNVLSTRTPDGQVTSYTYDAMNRVATVTNPAGRTAYNYDGDGNVTRISDANNHLTNFAYDGADQLIAKVVNGATWAYSYDAGGNLTTTTDPDGRTTTYDINARNLVTGIHYRWAGHSNIDVAYQYDNLDRVTTMTDATGTHSYTYTTSGSLATVTSGTNVFRYDYSTAGKRVVTYPDGTQVSYVSDDGGNLMSMAAGQAGQPGYVSASYVRNPAREAVSIAYSNGVATAQTWNVRGAIVDQTLSLRGTTVADTAYTYDGAGNRVSAATTFNGTTATQSYGYDATGRLTAVGSASQAATPYPVPPAPVTAPAAPANASTSTGAPTFPAPVAGPAAGPGPQPAAGSPSYGYDGVGNRLSATTAAGTTTFAYNAGDEITSQTGPTGSTTWTYDRSGNVTGENGPAGTTSFTYDAAGRVASVVASPSGGSTTTSTYTYDGSGNRVTKTVNGAVTRYLWDITGPVPLLAIEQDGSGNLIRRYFYGDGPVAFQTPTATYFFHIDPTGSVTQLTDSTGTIVASYQYDGFGNVTTTPSTGAPANPILFQGQYRDGETGLYNMRARLYDPATGRFTQRDRLIPAPGDSAMSPYVFVNDRPTVLVDPSGNSGTVFKPYTYNRNALSTPTVGNETAPPSVSASDANAIFDTKIAATGAAGVVTGVKLIGTYSSNSLKAFVTVKGAGPLEEGVVGDVKVVGEYSGAVRGVGAALAAAAFAFSVVIAAVDCDNAVNSPEDKESNIAKCTGDLVGLAFMVGCTAASSLLGLTLAASVACNLAGGVISFIIGTYGPQIYDGLVVGYESASAFTTGVMVPWVNNVVGPALKNFFVNSVYGGLVSGLNQLTAALSSGFDATMALLAGAGYSAVQLGKVVGAFLVNGYNDTIALMKNLGYDIVAIGHMLSDDFNRTADQAVALLNAGFAYTVVQLGHVLNDVYGTLAADVGGILQGVGYGITDISNVLSGVYGTAAADAVRYLNALQYGVTEIGGVLKNVFNQTADQAAQLMATISSDVAAIGGILKDVFSQTAQQVGQLLKDKLSATVDAISQFLKSAAGFSLAAAGAASLLKAIGFSASDIKNELSSLYNTAVSDIGNILSSIGFSNGDISALGGALSSFGQSVADCFSSFFSDC